MREQLTRPRSSRRLHPPPSLPSNTITYRGRPLGPVDLRNDTSSRNFSMLMGWCYISLAWTVTMSWSRAVIRWISFSFSRYLSLPYYIYASTTRHRGFVPINNPFSTYSRLCQNTPLQHGNHG
ncbi:hypothetical protein CALCODRAFT_254643 [Calocera cornea HHB12733]|uniref:Uncharacterized protein n=1 Tax=Calocera cornea HHB12733 TaxID=1353952 RepID=A0A165GML7_9BASI|nr:hypothetical protein CALCODRAFT_254643 [Calocera cornea HHB12733]